jgi:hypothetical protein
MALALRQVLENGGVGTYLRIAHCTTNYADEVLEFCTALYADKDLRSSKPQAVLAHAHYYLPLEGLQEVLGEEASLNGDPRVVAYLYLKATLEGAEDA